MPTLLKPLPGRDDLRPVNLLDGVEAWEIIVVVDDAAAAHAATHVTLLSAVTKLDLKCEMRPYGALPDRDWM